MVKQALTFMECVDKILQNIISDQIFYLLRQQNRMPIMDILTFIDLNIEMLCFVQ